MKEFKIIENKEIDLLNKKGRPLKKDRTKINDVLYTIKLTKEEKIILDQLAENESLSKAQFIKNKIFEGIVK